MCIHNEFFCPRCAGSLNPFLDFGIILLGVNPTRSEKGLLEVSAKVGNHMVKKPLGFTWEKGDKLKIACPICTEALNLEKDRDWAMISMKNGDKTFKIVFSTIVDVHATYQLDEENSEVKKFGPDISLQDILNVLP